MRVRPVPRPTWPEPTVQLHVAASVGFEPTSRMQAHTLVFRTTPFVRSGNSPYMATSRAIEAHPLRDPFFSREVPRPLGFACRMWLIVEACGDYDTSTFRLTAERSASELTSQIKRSTRIALELPQQSGFYELPDIY